MRDHSAPAATNQPRAAVVEEDIAEAGSESLGLWLGSWVGLGLGLGLGLRLGLGLG